VINDNGRTVALITKHGYVDWLLISPLQDGPLVDTIHKDTHLSYVIGLKFILTCPYINTETRLGTHLTKFSYDVEEGGKSVTLVGEGSKPNSPFTSRTEARLYTTDCGSRYEWELWTSILNNSPEPQAVSEIEYNNVYPALAYRGILHRDKKEFDCTLVQDEGGIIWEFPHQHSLHYGQKTEKLRFSTASWAGFFGSTNSCPVVVVKKSDLPLHWEICDMYYDLHCCARAPYIFAPKGKITFSYQIKYLSPSESRAWAKDTRKIPIDDDDKSVHDYPRFDFGLNRFDRGVHIDLPDEACCYRPSPPEKVWDRETGHRTKGSLRLTGQGEPIVWSSEPPFHAINGTRLKITGLAKVKDVSGKGFFIRLHYYHFCWEPQPGFQPIKTLESQPLTGTINKWIPISLPELVVPHGEVEDGMLGLEVVLEGNGIGWLTDVEIQMDCAPIASLEHLSLAITK